MLRGVLTLMVLFSLLPGTAQAGQALEIFYTGNSYGQYDPCPA